MPKTIDIRSLLPFQVRTKDQDNFTEGHPTEDQANTDSEARNARAKQLKLDTRYHVVPNPDFDQTKLDQARQSAGIKAS